MFLCSVLAGLYACRSTRYIAEDKFFLKKNTIVIKDASIFSLEKSNIESYIKQKTNTRILGLIPLKLYIHNTSQYVLKKNAGEAPVELDTALVQKSCSQIKLYLQNKGYLDCQVKDSVVTRKKRAKVYYIIHLNKPYTIQNISVSIDDDGLVKDIAQSNKKTEIQRGQIFDLDLFEQDRKHLVYQMKNRGYYDFSEEHVRYEADTSSALKKVDIYERVLDPAYYLKDSVVVEKHQKYYFNRITISDDQKTDPNDTSQFICEGLYCFSKNMHKRLNHNFFKHNLILQPNQEYKQSSVDLTYGRLSYLKIFKGVNIKTMPVKTDSVPLINVHIYTPFLPKNSVSIETNGTNRGGNLGVQAAIAYKNRNPFKSAETFEIRLRGGLEAQKSTGVNKQDQKQFISVFNTLEYGVESRLNIPKILFPFWKEKTSNWLNPKTEIHGLYNYQKITWFERDVIGIDWVYNWSTSTKNSFSVSLADINVVKVRKEPAFETILKELNNPFFTNTYNDHFIIGSRMQYAFNSREANTKKNYYSYRIGIEGSGNLLRSIYELYTKDTLPGKVFGIQFAQYLRTDFDLRIFQRLKEGIAVKYRFFTAVGVPFKNSVSLPFEKSFFSGGANGIRAWRIRSLGPGSFNQDISSFYKIGDMQLEANAELRFDIISIFKGAFFIDAGNIWLVNKDPDRPNGDFKIDRFYKEIAVGVGAGIRLDFDFFIIRFDYGVQMRDPALAEGERWLFQKKTIFNSTHNTPYEMGSNFNIGIDYPF